MHITRHRIVGMLLSAVTILKADRIVSEVLFSLLLNGNVAIFVILGSRLKNEWLGLCGIEDLH